MNSLKQYSNVQKASLTTREAEARALINMASSLNSIKENWSDKKPELQDILQKNQRLWISFAASVADKDSHLPIELRSGILNLSNFVIKSTFQIIENPIPEKLKILIDINMEIARGLSETKKPEEVSPAQVQSTSLEKSEEKKLEMSEKKNESDDYGDIFGE